MSLPILSEPRKGKFAPCSILKEYISAILNPALIVYQVNRILKIVKKKKTLCDIAADTNILITIGIYLAGTDYLLIQSTKYYTNIKVSFLKFRQ